MLQRKNYFMPIKCTKLFIVYLYDTNLKFSPYFNNTSYVSIDNFFESIGIGNNYKNEIEKLKNLTSRTLSALRRQVLP